MIYELQTLKWLFTSSVALAAMILASGCADSLDPPGSYLRHVFGDVPLEDFSEVPENKKPRVDLIRYGHDVIFFSGDDTMSPNEHRRLDDFIRRAGVGYADRLYVMAARGNIDPKVARDREKTVSNLLRRRGARVESLPLDADVTPMPGETVKVVVNRHVVTLPGCPDWSDRPAWNYNNTSFSNWGCATAVNLGLMVADPGDLERARAITPADAMQSSAAIERYRTGKTKALATEDTGAVDNQQSGGSGN